MQDVRVKREGRTLSWKDKCAGKRAQRGTWRKEEQTGTARWESDDEQGPTCRRWRCTSEMGLWRVGVGRGRVGVVTEVDVRRFILAWLVGWGGTGDDKA